MDARTLPKSAVIASNTSASFIDSNSEAEKCDSENSVSRPPTPVNVTMRPQNSFWKTTSRVQSLCHEKDADNADSAGRDSSSSATSSPFVSSPREHYSPVITRPIKKRRRKPVSHNVRQREFQHTVEPWKRSSHLHRETRKSFEDETLCRNNRSILDSGKSSEWSDDISCRRLRSREMLVKEEEDLAWSVFDDPRPSYVIPGNVPIPSAPLPLPKEIEKALDIREYKEPKVRKLFAKLDKLMKSCEDLIIAHAEQAQYIHEEIGLFEVILQETEREWEEIESEDEEEEEYPGRIKPATVIESEDEGIVELGLDLLGQLCDSIILHELFSEKENSDTELIWSEFRSMTKEEHDFAVGLPYNRAYLVLSLDAHSYDERRSPKLHDVGEKTTGNGGWFVESSGWTDVLPLLWELEKETAGEFWITFEDAQGCPEEIAVYRIGKPYYEIRFECQPVSLNYVKSTCFVLEVRKPTEIELSLFRKSRSATNHSMDDFNSEIFIFVKDPIDRVGELVAFEITHTRDVTNSLETTLECGEYFLDNFFVDSTPSVKRESRESVFALPSSREMIVVEQIRTTEFFHADPLISMSLCPELVSTLKSPPRQARTNVTRKCDPIHECSNYVVKVNLKGVQNLRNVVLRKKEKLIPINCIFLARLSE